jgi:hypothetical protein
MFKTCIVLVVFYIKENITGTFCFQFDVEHNNSSYALRERKNKTTAVKIICISKNNKTLVIESNKRIIVDRKK